MLHHGLFLGFLGWGGRQYWEEACSMRGGVIPQDGSDVGWHP